MSPPAPRISLMTCSSTPPLSGRVESHAAEQPPPESTNAIVNDLIPVELITDDAEGGSPQPRNRYGAAGDAARSAADGDPPGSITAAVAAATADRTAMMERLRMCVLPRHEAWAPTYAVQRRELSDGIAVRYRRSVWSRPRSVVKGLDQNQSPAGVSSGTGSNSVTASMDTGPIAALASRSTMTSTSTGSEVAADSADAHASASRRSPGRSTRRAGQPNAPISATWRMPPSPQGR